MSASLSQQDDELVLRWTLVGDDWRLLGNKTGATRLGFAMLLKFFELEARFARGVSDFPADAVAYVAEQVGVAVSVLEAYDFSERTAKRHRVQIREAFGFREFTSADEARLAGWLAEKVFPSEVRESALFDALSARCRQEKIEPSGRPARIVGTGRALFEQRLCADVVKVLGAAGSARLESLLADGTSGSLLSVLKTDPGPAGLESLLAEVEKLSAAQALGLPVDLFAGVSEKVVGAWRARAGRMYPSDFLDAPEPVRLTLLAALCHQRTAEIADGLIDLLLVLVLKINTSAVRVCQEFGVTGVVSSSSCRRTVVRRR